MGNADVRETPWLVEFAGGAVKQKKKLAGEMLDALYTLKHDLEQKGPVQTTWRNYSKIVNTKNFHHCHINNKRPRFVVVWKVVDLEDQCIEIRFIGPHGSVNYKQFQ